ncbi:NACHT domain-containing protein [Streptomyces rugosispiralis]|uniref:NACHT domain-containing protein n=1 Tax=Streptomyces rugosispiralis TaxID=2967341 RepID=A0ABT1URU5_9ACTN|nr:NACHT domain-containing protein [Streptomyces rugosispiralis]MCQ8187835.1 NACHT domain-containing protein [Streptomyces rugosispiralis]
MTGPGDVHNTFSGTAHGPVVMARDLVNATINITSPPNSRTAIALDEATAELAQALRMQWSVESERQRLWAPDTLAVRWRTIRNSPEAGPLPPEGELRGIADLYDQVPTKRLVVLGRAGSGKSALAIRFVLERLGPADAPVPVSVVPVIFSLGSWNPETPLRDWLTAQLERDHPGLATDGSGNATLATALVDRGRILPVLDGFDEIAEDLRPSALDKINDTASSRMPLLLTSRGDGYPGTGGVLAAAAIELTDLSPHDLTTYLPHTGAKTAEWKEVLEHLSATPESPAAMALRTPLMVALARTVYSDVPDHDPRELLTGRFPTVEALENHLLDSFIPTVYRDRPAAHRECVQDWLGHLARHLQLLDDTPDLAWWQLGSTLRRPVRMVVVGLVAGLPLGIVDGFVFWFLAGFVGPHGPVRGLLIGLANGAVLGLVAGLAFGLMHVFLDGGPARDPSRVHMRILGGTTRSRKTYVPRLAAGFTGGFGFGFVSWLVNALMFGLLQGASGAAILLSGLLNGAVGGIVGGLSLGFAYAGGTGEPSDEPLRFADAMREFRQRLAPRLAIGFAGGFGGGFMFWFADPLAVGLVLGAPGGFTSLLTHSLRAGIEGGLGYGLALGLAYGLAVALAHPIPVRSAVSPTALLGTDRMAVVHRTLLSTLTFGLVGWLFYGLGGQFLAWFVFTTVGGLGTGLAYGLSLTAWGHWVTLSRIWLPLTGRLPRNPGDFLKDAHSRGVLRQAGAVYQFRHARLRDRLTKQ